VVKARYNLGIKFEIASRRSQADFLSYIPSKLRFHLITLHLHHYGLTVQLYFLRPKRAGRLEQADYLQHEARHTGPADYTAILQIVLGTMQRTGNNRAFQGTPGQLPPHVRAHIAGSIEPLAYPGYQYILTVDRHISHTAIFQLIGFQNHYKFFHCFPPFGNSCRLNGRPEYITPL